MYFAALKTDKAKMKIVFFSFIFAGFFAFGYQLELKPNAFLPLDKKTWAFGQGQLTPNTTPVNLYSHKTFKDQQIVYEDMFLVKNVINQRLPVECQNKFNLENIEKSSPCKFNKDESAVGKYSFTVISLFKTATPDVYRVRSVYFIGQKKNIARLEKSADLILNSAPTGSKRKK